MNWKSRETNWDKFLRRQKPMQRFRGSHSVSKEAADALENIQTEKLAHRQKSVACFADNNCWKIAI